MERGRNIVLIGFMGSGKTSVGLKLSYRLRMTVEDTDKLIEPGGQIRQPGVCGTGGSVFQAAGDKASSGASCLSLCQDLFRRWRHACAPGEQGTASGTGDGGLSAG